MTNKKVSKVGGFALGLSTLFFMLVAAVCFESCAHYAVVPEPRPTPSVSPSPVPSPVVTPTPKPQPTVTPSPVPTQKIVTLKCDSGCTDIQAAQIPAIEAVMNRTLSGQCFADYIRSRTRIDYTKDTPDQIIAKLRAPISLTVNYYWRKYSTWPVLARDEGYEDANDFGVIHMNYYKTQAWPIERLASLALHEMSHAKSYWHQGNSPGPNYYSLPYTLNHMCESKSVSSDFGGCCQ